MKLQLLLASILLCVGAGFAVAQDNKRVDRAGLQFWAKFKTAVAKNDREGVASMTRLPFLLENHERTTAGFIEKFDVIFDARVKRCFARASPVKEGDGFEVFCGKQIFLFEKLNGVYKFTVIGVDD